MNKKCLGCGVSLQTTDAKKIGYVPEQSLEKGYCMRCFRLTHYHDLTNAYYKVDPLDILKNLPQNNSFCFFLCDFLNLNEETFNYYSNIKMSKCFVITKSDIIPKSIYKEKIKQWLTKVGQVPEDIYIISSKNNSSIKKIKELIISKEEENIYFLGMTNAGKSSLLNALEVTSKPLITSPLPNTTLDFITIDYLGKKIYDTAGFPYQNSLLTSSNLKKCNVKEEIHPIIMPLKKDAGLLIDDLFRIETTKNMTITCFFSVTLSIKKVYQNNLVFKDKEVTKLEVPKFSNINIKGIGFFYTKDACSLRLYNLEPDMISVIPSFLGGGY